MDVAVEECEDDSVRLDGAYRAGARVEVRLSPLIVAVGVNMGVNGGTVG